MTAAVQPEETSPRFRRTLRLVREKSLRDGLPKCYVRNPGTGEVFEMGEQAAFLCRKLDGTSSLATIQRSYEREFGVPLPTEQLEIFLRQLAHRGFLEGVEPSKDRTLPEIFDPEAFLPVGRIHLMSGDRLLGTLTRKLRWVFSKPFHAVAIALMLWAGAILLVDFFEILAAIRAHMSPSFLLLVVAGASIFVHSARSVIHGLLCKRYGRQVRDVSVSFLYYILPALSVDWRELGWVAGRRKRFWAIFSGIYYQLVLWSVATLGWKVTHPGSVANTFWLALLLAAGLGLVLFNANPLTKMDGYLLLVNWTEIPRLRERALATFGAWIHSDPPPEVLTRRELRWFKIYGLLCSTYAVFHIGLFFWGVWHFMIPTLRGIGASFTVLLFLFAVHKPLGHFMAKQRPIRWLFLEGSKTRRRLIRWGICAAIVALGFLPYPYEASGPFRLAPARQYQIRPEIEGMVEEVLVREGDWVEPGQPVLRLVEREHESRMMTAMAQMEEAQAKLELLKKGATPEEIMTAQKAVETAEAKQSWSDARAERFRQLFADEIIPLQEWENAKQAAVISTKELEEARANLDLVRKEARQEAIEAQEKEVESLRSIVENYRGDVERTVVQSPIAGRIVTPRVQEIEGVFVKPGQREVVVEVEDSRLIYAEVLIPEEDVAEVALDARVRLVTWAYHDEIFVGKVVAIAPIATVSTNLVVEGSDLAVGDPGLKVVRVMTEIVNTDGRLKSEMTGYAKIQIGDRLVWDVLLRPLYRWFRVEFWSWLP